MTIGKYSEALKLGKLAPDTALRELWGNHMQLTDINGGKVQYFLPWYFNETSFGNGSGSYTQNEGFYEEKKAFNFTFPSIRQGIRHEYVDVIKDMDPDDVRLALDRWVDIPVFDESTNVTASIAGVSNIPMWVKHTSVRTSGTLSDYVKLSALRYESNSDGRVVATYDLTSGSNRSLTHHALMLVPKEIGFIDDSYGPRTTIQSIGYTPSGGNKGIALTTTALGNEGDAGVAGHAYYYKGSSPLYIVSYRIEADGFSSNAISRSAALSQVLYACFADPDAVTLNGVFVSKTGVVPTLGWADGVNDQMYGVYNLDSNTESSSAIDTVIQSNARRVWTMLQRFFMPVDRFANCFTLDKSTHAFDPLEGAFYFGVCGTLAADCTQAVLERLDIYDQLGLDYTEDDFVKRSLIFR